MKYIKTHFDKLGLDYLSTYGNFVTFKLGTRVLSIYNKLLSHGIILRPLNNYSLAEYLRVTIGKDDQNRKFISTLKKLIQTKK